MADPTGALGLSDIAAMTGMDVKPAVASRPALDVLLGALPLGGAGDPVSLDGPTNPEPTGPSSGSVADRVPVGAGG